MTNFFHVLRETELHPRYTEEDLAWLKDLLKDNVYLKWAGFSCDGRYRQWIAMSLDTFTPYAMILLWAENKIREH